MRLDIGGKLLEVLRAKVLFTIQYTFSVIYLGITNTTLTEENMPDSDIGKFILV